jgi:hypothetical protein
MPVIILPRSRTAVVSCSLVITPAAEEEAPAASGSDPAGRYVCGIGADGIGTDTLGTDMLESGSDVVAAGSGSDIGSKGSDTRLVCCCSLPRTDRRLYVWRIGGRGLKAERRRVASDRERRKTRWRLGLDSRLPTRSRKTMCFCLIYRVVLTIIYTPL